MSRRWFLHGCGWMSLDKVCREHGCPRIHLQTPWFHFAVAVTPDARFASLDEKSSWTDFSRQGERNGTG